MQNICLKCGFNNPIVSRFCGNCGNRLEIRIESRVQHGAAIPQESTVPGETPQRNPQLEFLPVGQRRKVAILFADLSDSTELSEKIDSEILYEIIQQFIKMLANNVYKFDGTIDKFTGDGLMAIFGAPVAHENNSERAIHAAIDMQRGLSNLNHSLIQQYNIELQMHVGLNSGEVIVGSVGLDRLMDYTAIGETVNLAQRLGDAAGPGSILVSESVYHQTRTSFNFEAEIGLQLKGIAHPVNGYRLIGKKIKMSPKRGLDDLHAVMVGRDAEMQQLLGAVQSLVERNSGSFVLIRGEAGIGKTRLVGELIDKVKDKFVNVIHGRSLTYRQSIAYWVFQECLRQHIGVTHEMDEFQVSSKLSKQIMGILGTQSNDVLPYLEYMLSLSLTDQSMPERLSYLTADQLRQQIFIAVRNWLVAEAQYCPILLVLDDLHWADDASLELLLFLLDTVQTNPILILGISRPTEEGILTQIETRAQNRLGGRYHEIELKSLAPSQSEQLFCQLLTFPDLPDALRAEIIQRADGVPFYLEEILRMLIDDQVITSKGGRWQLNSGFENTTLGVPDNLQALILARFDRLDPTLSQLLQVASVIGNEFNLAVLSEVFQQDENDLRDMLVQLVKRAFLETGENGSFSEFSFRHVLTSDAIYSTLLRRDASDLHGKIGEAIEKIYPDRLNDNVYALARHYSLSQQLDKALHYLALAGDYASRDYLTAQARDYYEKAIVLLDKVPNGSREVSEIYIGLGDNLVYGGEYEKARVYFEKALELIHTDDPAQVIRNMALRRKISTTFERKGDFNRALEHLDAAQNMIADSALSYPVEAAQNLSDIGWINFRRGELERAEGNLSKALSLVESSTQYDVIASIYNRLGGIFYQKDDLEQSSYYVRKSLVLREEIGDSGAVARCYNNLGLLAWKRGNWDDALDDFSRSIELNRKLGDVEAMIFLHNNIGLLHTDKGNLDIALEHLDESLTRSQQVGHIALEGEVYLHFSRYWLAAEEWEKSLFYSQRALDIFIDIGSQDRLVDLYASMGEAWFGLGDMEKAYELGQKALRIINEYFEKEPSLPGRARILRLMGNIHRIRGDHVSARKDLSASITHFTGLKNQLELGRTYSDMVQLEKANGNLGKARIYAREAQFVFRKLGAKIDERKIESLTESLR